MAIVARRRIIYKLEIEFPQVPPSLNKTLRTHYHSRNEIFKEWYLLVENEVKNKRPDKPLEKCKIKIERCFFRFLDFDGAVASVKPVIDGLIHSDIISSDSYKVTGPWDLIQTFRRKKEGPLLRIGVYE